jgi:hypothetical protein
LLYTFALPDSTGAGNGWASTADFTSKDEAVAAHIPEVEFSSLLEQIDHYFGL